MNGDHRRVRIRATDGTPPLMLLGGNHHGGQGGVLLRRLIQGIQWVHTGQPAVSHHIQYGGRCGNLPLINRSGRGGKDTREVWEGIAEDDKTILHIQRALSSPHTDKLQEAVYILVGIFDRLGL